MSLVNRLDSISILFDDHRYIVVNKPFDCKIDGDHQDHPTVESILKSQLPSCPKLRNVHQLDYATSGVYVLATTKPAARDISKLFEERKVKKSYLAIVQGHMQLDSYRVDGPIDYDPNHSFKMCLSPTGRNAVTDIQVVQRGYYGYTIESNPTERRSIPVTKVKLFPITGRRHQLRVHLQTLGHSIVGDYNYQDDYTDTLRMMLHAWKLEAPLTPVPLNVEAPDPFIGLVTTEPP